ncbi:hypothetical protein GOP80_07150 [Planococcaceae bacterium Storch 2/2-2]|nr:hypothetical protein [Planococcaceae bacterium Storch 2/2-2]
MNIHPLTAASPTSYRTQPLPRQTTNGPTTPLREQYALSDEAKRVVDRAHIWSLHEKKKTSTLTLAETEIYHTARKTNETLDRALYEHDKAEMFEELFNVQSVVMKLIRGERLSPKEREQLERDPNFREEVRMHYTNQQLINRY